MRKLSEVASLRSCISAAIALSATTYYPTLLHAQALEEIVVTAQRRVQSLQEVPISIQAVSGLELTQNGFRTMEDMSSFAPSVEINESLHEWSVTIRGMGNDVANMSVEQSAPIFVDGIHFGRPSMIKGAFLDLERVEVLTGPQPIYFGQNATAGAFSLTTRKPTETWESEATAEFGNFGRTTFEGGIGGPVSESVGIRLAGKWDSTDGHLTDAFTGNVFPHREDSSARLTALWKVSENFEVLAKAEVTKRRSAGDTNVVCESEFPPPTDTGLNSIDVGAVLVRGRAPTYDALYDQRPIPNCAEDGFKAFGVQEGTGTYLAPLQGINNDDGRSGILDIRALAAKTMPGGDLTSREPLDAWNYRLGLTYELDSGITLESSTGLVDYQRETFESTDESPYLMEAARRVELFDMWSQEFRISSPSGGRIEWSAGAYYQKEELALDGVYTMRANIVQPLHIINPFNNAEWKSAFANFTFNFLDEKASIDIGGRYSDVSKDGGIDSTAATYIFDINPDSVVATGRLATTGAPVVDVVGDNRIYAVQHRPAAGGGDVVREVTSNIISCQTGLTPTGAVPSTAWTTGIPNHPGKPGIQQCGKYAGLAGYWTHEWREAADIPEAWDTRAPIALGPQLYGLRRDPGPFRDVYGEDSFDPQITLRYRPTANHSVYAKWAKAFKAGGFDTSDRGMPRGGLRYPEFNPSAPSRFDADGQKEFTYLAEHASVYEIGARGDLFDGRIRYGLTLFYQKIRDLQLETEIASFDALLSGTPSTGRFMTNAGAQRNRGLDFEFGWAASDRLTLTMAGVIQDSIMLDFIGGCTDAEADNADTGDCWSEAESIALTTGTALGATTFLSGFIDRTGYKAPRAPDWKVIMGGDYERPIFDHYVAKLNSKLAISDSYTQDTLGFTYVVAWPVHYDLNLLAGIGSAEGTWDINVYGRNFFGARQKYYPEYEQDFRGIVEEDMPASSFFTYGIQFNYHFK